MAETKKVNYLVQAWLVLMLAVSFGAAMAGVHLALNEGIQTNKRNETYDQIPKLIRGASKDRVESGVFTVDVGGAEIERTYYKALAPDGKTPMGYMLRASGMGYVDKIEVLIGVDAMVKNITGVYVLAQIETPGLGSKIRSEDFVLQFAAKSTTKEINALKTKPKPEENDIQAITSATISSQSVCAIVGRAVREFREHLDASIQLKRALANIPRMLPGVTQEQIQQIEMDNHVIYKVVDAAGEPMAWVAGGKRMGRWDRIDLLVALDPTCRTISKVHVVDQRERYWKSHVVKAGYVESFSGKKAERIVMVKKTPPAGQQVQAVTKATITSTAICRIVNKVVLRLTAAVAEIQNGNVAVKER
ncbi:MAG: FMN-binding protein [Phycisphaerae bacterium]|jgi:electron transport complex protein RnfG|nr:FMN-binding protein [Phycisphaerae bacterium]